MREERCEVLTALYEKIRLENMKHFGFGPEVMKSIKVCKECGAKANSELLFCPECDSPLPTETLYTLYVHSHFVCTKCKTVVSAKYKYCPQCGKKLIFE